jgi:organic radical activating enzyme
MSKICKKCLIPDSFPNITFSDELCQFCSVDLSSAKSSKEVFGKEALEDILSKKKIEKYDCLVPISGGKDSSYILYYLVKELKKKPLALCVQSDFQTEQARENVRNVCDELKVDCVIKKTSRFRKKIVQKGLQFSKALGRMVMPKICKNCENHLRYCSVKTAKNFNIPYIIWGASDFEDPPSSFMAKDSQTYRQKLGKNSSFRARIKGEWKDFKRKTLVNKSKMVFYYSLLYFYAVLDNICFGLPWKESLKPFLEILFHEEPMVIYFFDYIAYDPFKQIDILQRQTSWRGITSQDVRMDCKLHCFANYKYLKEMNITLLGFYYSNLVRKGLLDRQIAIQLEAKAKNVVLQECQQLAKELHVTFF